MPASRIDRVFERRLAAVINSGERRVLQGGRRGVEKESLRVTPAGRIATTSNCAASVPSIRIVSVLKRPLASRTTLPVRSSSS